jgi:hypothetical protein
MNFMTKLFGGSPAGAGTPPVPAQVTNNPMQNTPTVTTAASGQTAPNGVVPAGSANPPKEETPLKEFEGLWQTPATDPNAPKEPESLTPQQMMEAASKVDFTRVLAPDDLKKIAAGGEEAMTAFASAMNKVAQATYGQSTVVTQKLVDQAVAKERENFVASLPNLIKKHTLNDSAENPALRNPAVSPIISAIQDQLVDKYPKASTAELKEMATKIFLGAADMVAPKQKTTAPKEGEEGIDWDKWVQTSAQS